MAVDKDRLKNKIIASMTSIRDMEMSPDEARDKFADDLAQAIVYEFEQARATGTDSRGDTHNLIIE